MEKKSFGTNDIFNVFMIIVVLISSSLTFAFFYDYLPSIFPPQILGADISKIVSGLFGTIILEIGALTWLYVYLRITENHIQRNIAFQTSIISFSGSIITAFTKLIFIGNSLFQLTEDAHNTIGFVALFGIAFVLVFNFMSIWRFKKNSDESIESIEEANRETRLRNVTQQRQKMLDRLVEQKVRKKFMIDSDKLAEDIASSYYRDKIEQELGRRQSSTIMMHENGNESEEGETFPKV